MKPNYRRCVSCRQLRPKSEFFRLVKTYPSEQVQLDQGMGRSAYICRQADCLNAALKKNRLSRALKTNVPEEITRKLWEHLTDKPEQIP